MKKYTYSLTGDYIELIKLLKLLGIAENGAHAKVLVESGVVKVNHTAEYRKRCKIKKGSLVSIDNIQIEVD